MIYINVDTYLESKICDNWFRRICNPLQSPRFLAECSGKVEDAEEVSDVDEDV